jgi:PAS domain S-box-containing protein
MRPYIGKRLLIQYLLVFSAFFIMILVADYFGSHIISGANFYNNEVVKQVAAMRTALLLSGFAMAALLCTVITVIHISVCRSDEARKRARSILDAAPFVCKMWGRDLKIFDCNKAAADLFGLRDENEFMNRFADLSPQYQPDGMLSSEKTASFIKKAFSEGRHSFEWMHQKPDGTLIPAEITLVRVNYGKNIAVAGYIRDLREQKLP